MIDAHDGCDADSSAGEEQLVTYVEFAAVDWPFDDAQPQFAKRKFHDAVARDAFKRVLGDRGRDELSVAHHEDVAGGAFGDVSVLVEEDGFVEIRICRASSLARALFT